VKNAREEEVHVEDRLPHDLCLACHHLNEDALLRFDAPSSKNSPFWLDLADFKIFFDIESSPPE
jgi:hypothetical protein